MIVSLRSILLCCPAAIVGNPKFRPHPHRSLSFVTESTGKSETVLSPGGAGSAARTCVL